MMEVKNITMNINIDVCVNDNEKYHAQWSKYSISKFTRFYSNLIFTIKVYRFKEIFDLHCVVGLGY